MGQDVGGRWRAGPEDGDRREAGWMSACVHTQMQGRPGGPEHKATGRRMAGWGDWWEDKCEKGRNRADEKITGEMHGQEDKLLHERIRDMEKQEDR